MANEHDGSNSTIWHTQWYNATAPLPHEIQLDVGSARSISGLRYLPRQSGTNGRIGQYEIYTSTDGTTWGTTVATGTFADSVTEKSVSWTARTARYVRLRALTEAGARGPWTSAATITVIGI